MLGLSLGLVFVPCAGPVLTAIAVVGAKHRFDLSSVLLTAAFALGVAVPLLIFAVLGQRLAERMAAVRTHAATARRVIGAVLVVTALVVGLNLTDGLQRAVPGYTNALQSHIEGNVSARQALGRVTGNVASGDLATCTPASPVLQQCGPAPALAGISHWLNTPGDRPLTLAGLKGRVVLVDFWTYSCINCQRTLPHLEAWNRAYARDGLTIIGVHTPEFAFEHVTSNVAQAARQLGVQYPVAQDNDYATWNAYENNYWPAEYLIDATGTIRHVDFGEGEYGQTESFIRQLLVAAHPGVHLPPRHRRGRPDPRRSHHPGDVPGLPARHPQPGRTDGGGGPGWPPTRPRPPSRPTSTPTGATGRSATEASTAGTGATLCPRLPGQRRLPGARRGRHGPGLGRRTAHPDGRRSAASPSSTSWWDRPAAEQALLSLVGLARVCRPTTSPSGNRRRALAEPGRRGRRRGTAGRCTMTSNRTAGSRRLQHRSETRGAIDTLGANG